MRALASEYELAVLELWRISLADVPEDIERATRYLDGHLERHAGGKLLTSIPGIESEKLTTTTITAYPASCARIVDEVTSQASIYVHIITFDSKSNFHHIVNPDLYCS